MGLFGKDDKKDKLKDQVRQWCSKLRKENRLLDRQINAIQREEQKVIKQIKDLAKKGDHDVCRVLAKEVLHSRKATAKLYSTKARINSVAMSINERAAAQRMSDTIEKSTEVLQAMQKLIKVSEVAAVMKDLSREMMKAGIIEEMLDDAMQIGDEEDEEQETDQEIQRVLDELVHDQLSKAPKTPVGQPQSSRSRPEKPVEEEEDDDEEEETVDQMKARLEALRS